MVDTKKEYGVEQMTFNDEMELWKTNPAKAQTRNDKIRLHHALEAILSESRALIDYVKNIPEDDEAHHAEIVEAFTEEIESIRTQFTTCFVRHATFHG